jgi:hypothetical protein
MNSFPVISHIDDKPVHFCRYCLTRGPEEYEELELPWQLGG